MALPIAWQAIENAREVGTPYDGHTLAGQIDLVQKLTGTTVKRAYAPLVECCAFNCRAMDRGYRGHGVKRDGPDIFLSYTRGITSSAPSAPRSAARRVASMVLAVALQPVPART